MFGMNASHGRTLPKLESGSKYLPAIRLCHVLYTLIHGLEGECKGT